MSQPDTEQTRTAADELIVALLCRWEDGQITGPNAWLCRYAWVSFLAGQEIDIDAVIAEKLDWLNEPQNAKTRDNLVGCVDFIRTVAAKKPLWPLPDDSATAFNIANWMTQEDA